MFWELWLNCNKFKMLVNLVGAIASVSSFCDQKFERDSQVRVEGSSQR
jgi:hypothetical protein